MRKFVLAISLAVALTAAGAVALAKSGAGSEHGDFHAQLGGYQEVPAVLTTGHGFFEAQVQNGEIHYTLHYAALEQDATVAQIRFGQPGVNGNESAFLCGGGDKPDCPAREGTVEGVIDAQDVVGPGSQGIDPGSMDDLLHVMRAGLTYATIVTTFPAGDIRGQIRPALGGPPPPPPPHPPPPPPPPHPPPPPPPPHPPPPPPHPPPPVAQ